MQPDRRSDDGWHLDKKVSISHILTTAAIVAGLVAGWHDMDKRVVRLEITADNTAREVTQSVGRIEKQLSSLNNKFDQMLDRELNRNRHP